MPKATKLQESSYTRYSRALGQLAARREKKLAALNARKKAVDAWFDKEFAALKRKYFGS